MALVDFNIVSGGEIASLLNRLLQEIEIIMTIEKYQLITNPALDANLEQYLFKHAGSAPAVASKLQKLIEANITNDGNYDIVVTAEYMSSGGVKDMLYVDICVYLSGALQDQLIYTIT
jgi:hypothetical protein